MRHEILLGFDARISEIPVWTPERRSTYLLRTDVIKPLSTDTTVWPSVFDEPAVERPTWIGQYGCWENLDELRARGGDAPRHRIVAVSLLANENRLSHFSTLQGGAPTQQATPRSTSGWQLLGYDVSDAYLLSGLSNCGYEPAESAALKLAWSSRLNQKHLFNNIDDADEFQRMTDGRVREHAPFFVYALWEVP